MSKRLLVLISLTTILASCQSIQTTEPADILNRVDSGCHQLVTGFRTLVNAAGADNASARPIPGFPLLHLNRFLEGAADAINNEQQLTDWLELVIPLSLATRLNENANLSDPWSETELNSLADCTQLAATDNDYRTALRNHISASSQVRNHYISSRQWLGVYPLLRPFYLRSIISLHKEERQRFEEPEYFSQTNQYTSTQAEHGLIGEAVEAWFARALSRNSLAIPVISNEELLRLFQLHAPDLEIERTGDQDLVGSPRWADGGLALDTDNPGAFIMPSFTNFDDKNFLQLNYLFWFSERKPQNFIDLYSGNFDGIIWRVTLDHNGQVLLYDSIHPCGCYHKYFVKSSHVKILENPRSSEPANIFRIDELNTDSPVRISLSGNEHYIVGLANSKSDSVDSSRHYQFSPYDTLTMLDKDGQVQSMFDQQGLVIDSARLERFTLWPTGILSVGAMRQWGTHATGFIEKQHFDDFNLLDLYFEYEE